MKAFKREIKGYEITYNAPTGRAVLFFVSRELNKANQTLERMKKNPNYFSEPILRAVYE